MWFYILMQVTPRSYCYEGKNTGTCGEEMVIESYEELNQSVQNDEDVTLLLKQPLSDSFEFYATTKIHSLHVYGWNNVLILKDYLKPVCVNYSFHNVILKLNQSIVFRANYIYLDSTEVINFSKQFAFSAETMDADAKTLSACSIRSTSLNIRINSKFNRFIARSQYVTYPSISNQKVKLTSNTANVSMEGYGEFTIRAISSILLKLETETRFDADIDINIGGDQKIGIALKAFGSNICLYESMKHDKNPSVFEFENCNILCKGQFSGATHYIKDCNIKFESNEHIFYDVCFRGNVSIGSDNSVINLVFKSFQVNDTTITVLRNLQANVMTTFLTNYGFLKGNGIVFTSIKYFNLSRDFESVFPYQSKDPFVFQFSLRGVQHLISFPLIRAPIVVSLLYAMCDNDYSYFESIKGQKMPVLKEKGLDLDVIKGKIVDDSDPFDLSNKNVWTKYRADYKFTIENNTLMFTLNENPFKTYLRGCIGCTEKVDYLINITDDCWHLNITDRTVAVGIYAHNVSNLVLSLPTKVERKLKLYIMRSPFIDESKDNHKLTIDFSNANSVLDGISLRSYNVTALNYCSLSINRVFINESLKLENVDFQGSKEIILTSDAFNGRYNLTAVKSIGLYVTDQTMPVLIGENKIAIDGLAPIGGFSSATVYAPAGELTVSTMYGSIAKLPTHIVILDRPGVSTGFVQLGHPFYRSSNPFNISVEGDSALSIALAKYSPVRITNDVKGGIIIYGPSPLDYELCDQVFEGSRLEISSSLYQFSSSSKRITIENDCYVSVDTKIKFNETIARGNLSIESLQTDLLLLDNIGWVKYSSKEPATIPLTVLKGDRMNGSLPLIRVKSTSTLKIQKIEFVLNAKPDDKPIPFINGQVDLNGTVFEFPSASNIEFYVQRTKSGFQLAFRKKVEISSITTIVICSVVCTVGAIVVIVAITIYFSKKRKKQPLVQDERLISLNSALFEE